MKEIYKDQRGNIPEGQIDRNSSRMAENKIEQLQVAKWHLCGIICHTILSSPGLHVTKASFKKLTELWQRERDNAAFYNKKLK